MGHNLTMIPNFSLNPKCPMGIPSYSMLKNYTMMGV